MTEKSLTQERFSPTTFTKCDITTKARQNAGEHAEPRNDQRPLQQRAVFFDAIVDRQFRNLRNRNFERCPRRADEPANNQIAALITQQTTQKFPAFAALCLLKFETR